MEQNNALNNLKSPSPDGMYLGARETFKNEVSKLLTTLSVEGLELRKHVSFRSGGKRIITDSSFWRI